MIHPSSINIVTNNTHRIIWSKNIIDIYQYITYDIYESLNDLKVSMLPVVCYKSKNVADCSFFCSRSLKKIQIINIAWLECTAWS